jgi:hypothetical protein
MELEMSILQDADLGCKKPEVEKGIDGVDDLERDL